MTLGEQIKAARKRAGINQTQLATKMGVSLSTVQGMESGRIETRFSHLAKTLVALQYFLTNLWVQTESGETVKVTLSNRKMRQ